MTKPCPRCKDEHEKPGTFCSRSCANSRGPRSSQFKQIVSAKLKGRPSPKKGTGKPKPVNISEITGNTRYSDYWSHPARTNFLRKVAGWFNISLGSTDTIIELEKLQKHLEHLYYEQNLSSIEIKEQLNIPLPNGHMTAFLTQFKIKSRCLHEAGHIAMLKGRISIPSNNPKYKHGWHTDFEEKKHYYRSSYELAFYKKLDEKQITYDTESIRLEYYDNTECKMRVAIPDVVLPNNVIFEIKSTYGANKNKENLVDKFISYRENGYRPLMVVDGKIWWRIPESNWSKGV